MQQIKTEMLTEKDKEELKTFGRIRCPNCFYFNRGTGYCNQGDVKHYKVCEPERYKKCENYKDRDIVSRSAVEHLKKIREILNKGK